VRTNKREYAQGDHEAPAKDNADDGVGTGVYYCIDRISESCAYGMLEQHERRLKSSETTATKNTAMMREPTPTPNHQAARAAAAPNPSTPQKQVV